MNSEMIFYTGLGVMSLTTLLVRTVKERGMKSLSHEQLGFVMASFSKMRIVGMCIWFWVI